MNKLFTTLAFALLVTGCGGGSGPAPVQPAADFDGDLSKVLTISIENQQLNEARVFLLLNFNRVRLGSVRGNQTETFHVPMDAITQVHMEFDLSLGEHCVTRDVSLGPGDKIDVSIPVNLDMMMQAVCRGR